MTELQWGMRKWERGEYYIGEDMSEYYILYARNRDSGILDNSNFDTALKLIGGESETVIVARFTHWAVGWVEEILIHESDADKVKAGDDLIQQLARYPILDEEDFSRREWDAAREMADDIKEDIENDNVDRWPGVRADMTDEEIMDYCLERVES